MKIGINATFLNEKPTGLGVFTQEISSCIPVLNSDFVVFSPVAVKGVSEDRICRVPPSIMGSLRFSANLSRALYVNSVLPLLCRNKKIDVLFCPMIEYPLVPLVPLVVHVHDLHPIKFAPQFRRAAAHFRLHLRRLEKAAKRVTVSSEFVKNEILGSTRIKEEIIDVVPLAFNHSLFYPRDVRGKEGFLAKYSLKGPYILTVGNLFPYKNLDTLVEAFLKIKAKIAHSLVVVGRTEFSARRLTSDDRIIYTDYVPDEDLPHFYSYADVLVHPSLSEGFGLTPLEAMACGIPVIASSAGSLPEVVDKAGLLFNPRDSHEMSELIFQLISDEGLRLELRERGLRRAKQFSWEKTAAGIISSCERALGNCK